MAEAVDLAAALSGGDNALGAGQAHGDGNLDQRVLAGFETLDSLRLVLLAGTAQDHDIDGRISQRRPERHRPLLVAVLRSELLGGLFAPADDRMQDRIGALQCFRVPLPHHSVSDHADVQRHDQPLNFATGTPGTSTSSAKMPPVSGLAASFSALTFSRSEVMKIVFMSGPPKQGMVGAAQGSGIWRSSLPSSDQRLRTPAEMPALQYKAGM